MWRFCLPNQNEGRDRAKKDRNKATLLGRKQLKNHSPNLDEKVWNCEVMFFLCYYPEDPLHNLYINYIICRIYC